MEKELMPFEPPQTNGFCCEKCANYVENDKRNPSLVCLYIDGDMESDDFCSLGMRETAKYIEDNTKVIDGMKVVPGFSFGMLTYTLYDKDGKIVFEGIPAKDAAIYAKIFKEFEHDD